MRVLKSCGGGGAACVLVDNTARRDRPCRRRRRRTRNMSSASAVPFLIATTTTLFLLSASTVLAEEEQINQDFNQTTTTTTIEDTTMEEDSLWIIVMAMSLLVTTGISLFGSLLAYVAVRDQSILHHYHTHGTQMMAWVLAKELRYHHHHNKSEEESSSNSNDFVLYSDVADAEDATTCCSGTETETTTTDTAASIKKKMIPIQEYTVTIQYDTHVVPHPQAQVDQQQQHTHTRKLRVQKQIRARSTDLFQAPTTTVAGLLPPHQQTQEQQQSLKIEIEPPPPPPCTEDACSSSNSSASLYSNADQKAYAAQRTQSLFYKNGGTQTTTAMNVLVLSPEYPQSAISHSLVLRSQSLLRYRLTTVCMTVLILCLTVVSFGWSWRLLQRETTSHEDADDSLQQTTTTTFTTIAWSIYATFCTLTVFQLPIIHWCWGTTIQSALEEEYYGNPCPEHDCEASLSTHGSDIYLLTTRRRSRVPSWLLRHQSSTTSTSTNPNAPDNHNHHQMLQPAMSTIQEEPSYSYSSWTTSTRRTLPTNNRRSSPSPKASSPTTAGEP